MSLHLIKLCVGVDDIRHLARIQAGRQAEARRRGDTPELRHVTRNTPRRAAEILDGGSLYWVTKGFIRVRQPVIDIRSVEREDGRPACALVLDPVLTRTEIRSFRRFQGWRYLAAEDAPRDAPPGSPNSAGSDEDVPAEMAAELRGLGLL